MHFSEIKLSNGISLHDCGINNWALTQEQALRALDKLEEHNFPIPGGDVYEIKNGTVEPNHENWYCEKLKYESREAFSHRSINQARHYIKNYQIGNKKILFCLVIEA